MSETSSSEKFPLAADEAETVTHNQTLGSSGIQEEEEVV